MSWLGRLLYHRSKPRPLATSKPALDATHAHYVATIAKADRVLEDYRRFDGAIRVVIVPK